MKLSSEYRLLSTRTISTTAIVKSDAREGQPRMPLPPSHVCASGGQEPAVARKASGGGSLIRATCLSLTESWPTPLVEGCSHRSFVDCRIAWARTAKKSTKPEEPKIEGKKCERRRKHDVARECAEQDQRVDFLRVLRIVVDVDPVTGIHHGHADVAAEALPSIGLSIDDVCERSAGTGKVFGVPRNSAATWPRSCDCTTVTTVWGQVDFWTVLVQ